MERKKRLRRKLSVRRRRVGSVLVNILAKVNTKRGLGKMKKGKVIPIIGGDSSKKVALIINKVAVFDIINGKKIPAKDIFVEVERVKLDDRGLPTLKKGKFVTEFIRTNIVSFKIGYIEEIKKKKPWKIA